MHPRFFALTASVLMTASLWLPGGQAGAPTLPQGRSELRKMLHDPKPEVRLQAALALARDQDAEAIPVLIDLLAEVSPAQGPPIEDVLRGLAGAWAPRGMVAGDDDVSRRARRDAWASWWQRTAGATLLDEFRKRTLTPANMEKLGVLIDKLGDDSYAVRERATAALVDYGPGVAPLLRDSVKRATDPEQRRRLEFCMMTIASNGSRSLPPAAVRLVALRKPTGAVEALLAFLPWTEDGDMVDEIRNTLTALAMADTNVIPALARALDDARPARRAVAAEVLAGVGDPTSLPVLRKLLHDPHPAVRLCVAMALVQARDKEAVPALIELAADVPREQAWHAAEVLQHLAGDQAPRVGPGKDAASRAAYRAAWQAWWHDRGASVDLAQLRLPTTRKPVVAATASKSGKNDTPDQAFDGDRKTAWNSTGFVPQWIEADLGVSSQLAGLVLVVNQDPAGDTTHEVWVSNEPIGWQPTTAKLVHTFKGATRSLQELRLAFPKEMFARYVQIRTTESVGWVAWMEIELRIRRSPLSLIDDPERWRNVP
jgi:HEAT repeat protein